MSFFTSDQFAAVHKNNLANLAVLSNRALEGIQKLTELNLQAAKAALAEGQESFKAVATGKDLREALAAQGSLSQNAADKAVAYARQVCEIASQAHAELAKAVEEQYEQHYGNVQAFVDTFVKNAPAGSETIIALLQSTVDGANQSYRSAQAISRQVTDLATANFAANAEAAMGTAKQATSRTSKA
ncbi:TIGR01841 family phasin [Cupriavidus sp. CV2]|uniref:TIGR01841 family phasin n=1 Tax=Cupriavidus ulmosensis TaxID=3065913 RepID=UPI00296AA3E8|nr:TIGR01841 family phasin [Cupriavidus sp. CV2]MDW3683210.1 TIGR01841 family phasin [Cupriavidus sp. CV2]